MSLLLDSHYVTWDPDGESVTIDLPEAEAHQLADQLLTAIIRLKHLRVLFRRGRLTPDAVLEVPDEEDPRKSPVGQSPPWVSPP